MMATSSSIRSQDQTLGSTEVRTANSDVNNASLLPNNIKAVGMVNGLVKSPPSSPGEENSRQGKKRKGKKTDSLSSEYSINWDYPSIAQG